MSVTAESLFRDFFWPLLPEDVRADLARARATDINPGKNPAIFAHLDEAAAAFVANAPALFGEGAPLLDHTDASIHRLSHAMTKEARDRWMGQGRAGTPENVLFNAIVHAAAYVGSCIVRQHGGEWRARRPLWESLVFLRSRAGEAELAPFHWLLRSLADDATETLADRYRTLVEVPCARPEELPVLAPPDRRLPRLANNLRYDVLYKYLKAHLPELKDLGQDFPSAERFAELGLKWLDLRLLGDGRMLLLAGPGQHGLHLFWLTKAGFEKSVFIPADAFPEPIVRTKGDKLEIVVSAAGKPAVHEMLWWGP